MAAAFSNVEELYRAAVGEKKAEYYVPLFEKFDAGGRASWNWPSFFVTFVWLLYRRMYGLALIYFFVLPFALAILGGILVAVVGPDIGVGLYVALILAVQFVLIPIYANVLYHWHINNRINKASMGAPSREALEQRLIGQAATSGPVVIVAVVCVGGVALIGILAAISIPAYHDYTIRAQVTEGLNLAAPVKLSVAEAYKRAGSLPLDLADAGLNAEELTGQYTAGIEVVDGVVLIRYGNGAHTSITNHTLSLHPVGMSDAGMQWSCGYAHGDDTQTDIPMKYLPSLCRARTLQ